MKKFIICMAIGIFLMFGIVSADAARLLGTQMPTSGINGAYARIYEIDPNTCTSSLIVQHYLPPSPSNWNGNAYDALNDLFYFAKWNGDNSSAAIYYNDFYDNSLTYVGTTTSHGIACGTFYNGKYYYIHNATDDLRSVTMSGGSMIDTKVGDITGNTKTLKFGDVAYDANGILYGSATATPGGNIFFIYDPANTTSPFTSYTASQTLQLAFGSDGVLYGHNANSGDFYTVSTTDGTLTSLCTSSVKFADLAAGESLTIPPPMINIKPGSDPNSINTCSGGSTPVTIWGSETFDVSTIDISQIVLATASVKTVGKSNKSLCSIKDVGSFDETFFDNLNPTPDGYPDLTCHFVTYDLGLTDSSAFADLTITGCDDGYNSGCTMSSPGYYEVTASDAVNIVKDCE